MIHLTDGVNQSKPFNTEQGRIEAEIELDERRMQWGHSMHRKGTNLGFIIGFITGFCTGMVLLLLLK